MLPEEKWKNIKNGVCLYMISFFVLFVQNLITSLKYGTSYLKLLVVPLHLYIVCLPEWPSLYPLEENYLTNLFGKPHSRVCLQLLQTWEQSSMHGRNISN